MKTVKEVIDDLFDQAEALRVQASEAEAKGLALQEEVVALKTGLEQEVVFIGPWDCETSPIGVCAFNSEKDEELDKCMFCGEPDDRK